MSGHLNPWVEKILDKTIQTLQNDVLKKKIQILILQPFIQYFIELIFPYIIIICVVFGVMIILMLSILVILVFKIGNIVPSFAAASAAVAAI